MADGQTPMCQVLRVAYQVTADFVSQHPDCFPPIVFNITDGAANDGDPSPGAASLRGIASSDGNVLLFNLHISKRAVPRFSTRPAKSACPTTTCAAVVQHDEPTDSGDDRSGQNQGGAICRRGGRRGFAFNADMASVTTLLDIATVSST